jgi:hypothetical protein
VVVTKANEVEVNTTDSLLAQVLRALDQLDQDDKESLAFFVADSAYDSAEVYDQAFELFKAQLISPPNPRRSLDLKDRDKLSKIRKEQLLKAQTPRSKGILSYYTTKGKKIYKQRIIVDQVFEQLKHTLKLANLPYWIKGVRRVAERVRDTVFGYVAMML